jgi:hypothetical protein
MVGERLSLNTILEVLSQRARRHCAMVSPLM